MRDIYSVISEAQSMDDPRLFPNGTIPWKTPLVLALLNHLPEIALRPARGAGTYDRARGPLDAPDYSHFRKFKPHFSTTINIAKRCEANWEAP